MKNVLLKLMFVITILFTNSILAQQNLQEIQTPEFNNEVMKVNSDNTLSNLDKEVLSYKHAVGVGFCMSIKSCCSNISANENNKFVVMLESGINPDIFKLIKMGTGKNYRRFLINKVNSISVSYKKIKEGVYLITVDSHLEQGEYGFVANLGTPASMAMEGTKKVFCFRVEGDNSNVETSKNQQSEKNNNSPNQKQSDPQNESRVGEKALGLGIGLNSTYSKGTPLCFFHEKRIMDNFSFGGEANYLSYTTDIVSTRVSMLFISLRGTYHLNKTLNITDKKTDLYCGGSLGYRLLTSDNEYSKDKYPSSLFLSLMLGCKYYLASKTAAFLELGALGCTNLKVGLSFVL